MATPASGVSAYGTPGGMAAAYDVRSLGQLLSDSTVPLTPGAVLASPVLGAYLKQASGMVESACTVGGAYRIDNTAVPPVNDLAALTGNSAAMLERLVYDLAMWLVWNRRPLREPKSQLPAQCELALDMLDKLREGERVLGISENMKAGNVNNVVEDPVAVFNRNGLTVIAGRLFGNRVNQYPQLP